MAKIMARKKENDCVKLEPMGIGQSSPFPVLSFGG